MVGAGLLVRSLGRLRAVDPGFDPRQRPERPRLAIPDARYATPRARPAFYGRVLDRVRALPGVEAAGAMNTLPLTDGGRRSPSRSKVARPARSPNSPRSPCAVLTPGTLTSFRHRACAAAAISPTPIDAASAWRSSSSAKPWPSASGPARSHRQAPRSDVLSRHRARDRRRRRRRQAARPGQTRADRGPLRPARPVSGRDTCRCSFARPQPARRRRRGDGAVRAVDPDQPVEESGRWTSASASPSPSRASTCCCSRCSPGSPWCWRPSESTACWPTPSGAARARSASAWRSAPTQTSVRLVVLQGMRPALIGLAIGLAASLALGRALREPRLRRPRHRSR